MVEVGDIRSATIALSLSLSVGVNLELSWTSWLCEYKMNRRTIVYTSRMLSDRVLTRQRIVNVGEACERLVKAIVLVEGMGIVHNQRPLNRLCGELRDCLVGIAQRSELGLVWDLVIAWEPLLRYGSLRFCIARCMSLVTVDLGIFTRSAICACNFTVSCNAGTTDVMLFHLNIIFLRSSVWKA